MPSSLGYPGLGLGITAGALPTSPAAESSLRTALRTSPFGSGNCSDFHGIIPASSESTLARSIGVSLGSLVLGYKTIEGVDETASQLLLLLLLMMRRRHSQLGRARDVSGDVLATYRGA